MRYRRKPIIVDAIQLDETLISVKECLEFMGQTIDNYQISHDKFYDFFDICRGSGGIVITTLEGQHLASWNDWIIRGVKGEFYPCKPDIFPLIYEEVRSFEVRR